MDYDDEALMIQKDSNEVNARLTPDGRPESLFRQRIRDLLDLDFSARDQRIYDEIRRLKAIEQDAIGVL